MTPLQLSEEAITPTVDEQGVKVLVAPLGHREIVEAQLRIITAEPSAFGQDSSGHGSAMRVVVVALLRKISPQQRVEGGAP